MLAMNLRGFPAAIAWAPSAACTVMCADVMHHGWRFACVFFRIDAWRQFPVTADLGVVVDWLHATRAMGGLARRLPWCRTMASGSRFAQRRTDMLRLMMPNSALRSGSNVVADVVGRSSERYIAGTTVVVFILATTRWGTNIGVMPLFVTDLLLALCVFHLSVTLLNKPRSMRVVWPGLPYMLFLVYVIMRTVASVGQSSVVDWARDAAPYLYASVALVSALSIARSTPKTRARTARALEWALLIHLAWVAIVIVLEMRQGLSTSLPFFRIPPLQLRGDVDAAFVGLAAGVALWRLLNTSGFRVRWVMVMGLAVLVQLQFSNRAALISTVLVLVTVYTFTLLKADGKPSKSLVLVAAIPALVSAGILVLISTVPGQRLLATFNPEIATTAAQANAVGTANARATAWERVVLWTNDAVSGLIFGAGFGPDFLTLSGAYSVIAGTDWENVRSPHNYFVGSYARLGLIGTVLLVLLLLHLLRVVYAKRTFVVKEELFVYCLLVLVTILPIASLGVVLESPFGAIPFFWGLGILMTLRDGPPAQEGVSYVSDRVVHPKVRRVQRPGFR